MPHVQSAPPVDRRAPERFLCSAERRALQMAALAVPGREVAVRAVEDTIHAFAARCNAQAESSWAALFWTLLDTRLTTHHNTLRPRWRAWFGSRAETADADDPPGVTPDPSAHGAFMDLADDEALGALTVALQTLPMPARHAFLLRVRENLDVPATAKILRRSDAVVRTQLFRALQQLRARLRTHPQVPARQAAHADGVWILRCRTLLDRAARDLDDTTLSRLNLARHAALAPATVRPRARGGGRWLVRAGGLAIAVGIALALTRLLPAPDVIAPPAPAPLEAPAPPPPRIAPSEDTPLAAPDFDLLLDADDEALLDELEFHAWLAADALRDD